MCGIFGATNLKEEYIDKARSALHTLAHRGPDGFDDIHQNNVYLGHRRLSILDLSKNGKQPMHKDGVYLTANGEIYNYKELNKELINDFGVEFKSQSDSETILHGYIHWGINKLLDKLDGMFAFSIYDVNNKCIYLARDHVGIKPLYYSTLNGLSWASELKALENYHSKKELEIDYTAVYDFLTYKYIPSPKSLYQNIYKLKPGHYAKYDTENDNLSISQYWSLKPNRHLNSEVDVIQKMKDIVSQAVKSHLVSDVPVGSFLSGGADSSIVSYEASKILDVLNTCSIGFDDPNVDETQYAQAVADKIKSNHKVEVKSHSNVNEEYELLKQLFDEPFADTSAFPTYWVSKLASKDMTVVLTGDGGDELFGGYNHYNSWYQKMTPLLGVLSPLRLIISSLKNLELGKVSSIARKLEPFSILCPLERRVRLTGGVLSSDKFKKEFRLKHNIPRDYDDIWHYKKHYRKELPLNSRAMYLDFHTYMTEDVLCKVDRASMACSIETRVPLLSKSVINFAWSIDESLLFKNNELKYILKKSYKDVIPQHCLYRGKQGFSLGKTNKGDRLHVSQEPLVVSIVKNQLKEAV